MALGVVSRKTKENWQLGELRSALRDFCASEQSKEKGTIDKQEMHHEQYYEPTTGSHGSMLPCKMCA